SGGHGCAAFTNSGPSLDCLHAAVLVERVDGSRLSACAVVRQRSLVSSIEAIEIEHATQTPEPGRKLPALLAAVTYPGRAVSWQLQRWGCAARESACANASVTPSSLLDRSASISQLPSAWTATCLSSRKRPATMCSGSSELSTGRRA